MDFSFSFKSKPTQSASKVSQSAAATQFAALRDAGLEAAQGVTAENLSRGQPKGAFDNPPFAHLLALMGGVRPDGQPWSDDVWLLTPPGEEGIDFAGVLTNLARLTKRCVEVGGVEAGMDEERGVIVVNAEVNGEAVGLELPADDPLTALLSQFAGVAAQLGEGARLAATDVEAGRLFVWRDEEGLGAIAGATGLEWAWIE